MKNFILDKCMNTIRNNKDFDEVKLSEIKYGLESLYLMFSKLIIISFISIILGIFKYMVIFILLYNIVRMPSFGLHASKSWICLVFSTLTFIGIPLLCLYLNINIIVRFIIGVFSVIGITIFSPADTKKRPIVSKKRRLVYKILSFLISLIYFVLTFIVQNNYVQNCLLFSLIVQNVLISPLTYKLFNMPYNNYKLYIKRV